MIEDARLTELDFLSRLEREGSITIEDRKATDADVRVAIHLLAAGLVNDATAVISNDEAEFQPLPGIIAGFRLHYRERLEVERWKAVGVLHRGGSVTIVASHASSVRRAFLAQEIQRGRLREAMGILIDGRYAKRDLQVALYSATPSSPVTVAFLDLNGLKVLNDTHGHDAGDDAIRAYFEVVADVVAEVGEAHRVGGDEVVITFPRTSLGDGAQLVRMILRGLKGREVRGAQLTAVAGVTSSTDPNASASTVRQRADTVQYRAKKFSKQGQSRCAALAIDDREESIESID